MIIDCDISENEWNRYIKKQYGKKYRCFRDELNIWSIKCKYCFIQPYSIIEKELVAVLTYKTQRGVNLIEKELQSNTALEFRISQHGDYEICIVFNEKNIKQMSELLSFGHRRQISENQRKILVERLKKARFVKNGGH